MPGSVVRPDTPPPPPPSEYTRLLPNRIDTDTAPPQLHHQYLAPDDPAVRLCKLAYHRPARTR
jgi:hypothetical protein